MKLLQSALLQETPEDKALLEQVQREILPMLQDLEQFTAGPKFTFPWTNIHYQKDEEGISYNSLRYCNNVQQSFIVTQRMVGHD